MDYRKIVNGIAVRQLIKSPDMPDYHLMIGTAEQLDNVSLLIPQHKVPSEVAKGLEKLETISNETIEQAIINGTLEVNDFNYNNAVIAGMIGGGAL